MPGNGWLARKRSPAAGVDLSASLVPLFFLVLFGWPRPSERHVPAMHIDFGFGELTVCGCPGNRVTGHLLLLFLHAAEHRYVITGLFKCTAVLPRPPAPLL